MKYTLLHILTLLAAVVLLAACGDEAGNIRIEESFSKNDKKAFGANIAYRQIEAMYQGNIVRDKKQSFKTTWQNISDTNALYICLAPKLYVTEEEVEAMLEYVDAGNTLFISAGFIDPLLLGKINAAAVYSYPQAEQLMEKMKNTSVSSVVKPVFSYSYFYYPFQNHFTKFDKTKTRVLGYNAAKEPNSIVYFHGSGRLYLHCDPRAFSNYFLLKENNYEYLKNTLAYTLNEPQHLYWDDYYNKLKNRKESDEGFSTFSEIMKHPPLVYAFWLSLLLLALYILFGGKRLQRIVEEVKPNENTTVTFTETIGRLYLQKKDNKNIADKMITYFNEYIRNTYFLNTNHINDDFIVVLSRKSGVEKDRVETLYRSIVATHKTDVVTDYQLLSLQEQIQNFYKNTI